MNYINYRNKLDKTLQSYILFLPFLDNEMTGFMPKTIQDAKYELLDEILFLRFKIAKIDSMSIFECTTTIEMKSIIYKSKLN